ncbi:MULTISPECIES: glycosyl hydrolase family 28-related protein [Chitinophagaceae]
MKKKHFVHTFLWVSFLISHHVCVGQSNNAPSAKNDPCPETVFLKTASDIPADPVYTAQDEHIFWISPAAEPGDKVLVKGAFTGTPKQIELALIQQNKNFTNAAIVNAIPMGTTGISFEIPKSMSSGVYQFRIDHNDRLIGIVNQPTISWTEGIGAKITPDAVQPGDSLLIAGTNLPDKGYVILKGKNEIIISYTANTVGKRIMIKIPETVILQQYSLQVSTSKVITAASSNSYAINIIKKEILPIKEVTCSRLIGDGITDNTAALQDYLKETSSQYRLYFKIPIGTFLFSKQLILLPNQFLVGAGQEKTILKAQAPDASVPNTWIRATSHFGLMQLSCEAPVKDALVGNYDNANNKASLMSLEDIFIDNIKMTCAAHSDAFVTKVSPTTLLKIAGKSVTIVNSTFNNVERRSSQAFPKFTDNAAIRVYPINGSIIRNNKFELGDWGLALYIIGYQNALVEKNEVIGKTKTPGAGCGFSVGISKVLEHSRNILVLDNRIENITSNNREAITTDFAAGTYTGMITKSDNQTTTLPIPPKWTFQGQSFIPNNYIATIIAGRGIGQYRYIQSTRGNTIILDTPWDIVPDETSAISITLSQTNVQIVRNDIYNSGRLQFYGNVFNGEISNNHINSSLGIMLHSAIYMCTSVPLQNIAITSNEFSGKVAQSATDNMGMIVRSNFNGGISGIIINKNRTQSDSTGIKFTMIVSRIKPALIYGNTKQIFRLMDTSPKPKIAGAVRFQAKSLTQADQGIAIYQ